MNEIKGGTPIKPYKVGQMVWNRVLERMCEIREVNRGQMLLPGEEVPATIYRYRVVESPDWFRSHELAEKNPSAPMFQSGDEVPSTSMRNALEWYAEQAEAMARYAAAENYEAMLAVAKALELDAGKRGKDARDEDPLAPAIEKAFARARELFHSPETENTAVALGALQTVYLLIKEELNAKV